MASKFSAATLRSPQTFLRVIEISRPIFWPSTFLVFLLGVVFSGSGLTAAAFVFAFLWAFPYSLWICAVNDLADTETDAINPYKGSLSGAKTREGEGKFLERLAILSLTAIVAPSVLFRPEPAYLLWAAIALLVPYAYSARPFRLKEHPPLDSASNGAFVAAVFLCGFYFAGGSLTEVHLRVAAGIFLIVSAIHIVGALRDYTPDRKTKTRTIAVAWGQRPSALVASVLFALAFFIIPGLPAELRAAAAFAALCGLWLAFRPNEKQSLQLGLATILIFCAAVSVSILTGSWKSIIGG